MFQVGDFMIYGNKGVCKVENVGILDSADMPKDTVYYTLFPYFLKGSKIYSPVDNDKVNMRPIITKEDAMKLIDDIKSINSLWVSDEKNREFAYKEAVKKSDCRELIRIIKTIYIRKQSRLIDGKKVSSLDTKYYKLAEENFYGELSVSLGMGIDAVREIVLTRLKQSST